MRVCVWVWFVCVCVCLYMCVCVCVCEKQWEWAVHIQKETHTCTELHMCIYAPSITYYVPWISNKTGLTCHWGAWVWTFFIPDVITIIFNHLHLYFLIWIPASSLKLISLYVSDWADVDCGLGHILKVIVKNDTFVNKVRMLPQNTFCASHVTAALATVVFLT